MDTEKVPITKTANNADVRMPVNCHFLRADLRRCSWEIPAVEDWSSLGGTLADTESAQLRSCSFYFECDCRDNNGDRGYSKGRKRPVK